MHPAHPTGLGATEGADEEHRVKNEERVQRVREGRQPTGRAARRRTKSGPSEPGRQRRAAAFGAARRGSDDPRAPVERGGGSQYDDRPLVDWRDADSRPQYGDGRGWSERGGHTRPTARPRRDRRLASSKEVVLLRALPIAWRPASTSLSRSLSSISCVRARTRRGRSQGKKGGHVVARGIVHTWMGGEAQRLARLCGLVEHARSVWSLPR